ncbi:MAG: CHAD domain-containing protein [Bacteroidales bacterium]|nr:CHAD domain-containing protein [Bacteroidales bacterium]
MSYKLNLHYSLDSEIKRIILDITDDSLKHLARGNNTEETIHEIRKNMKKARGAVRLVRDIIGKEKYGDMNVFFRDTAREVSKLRDSYVMIQTMKTLRNHLNNQSVESIEIILDKLEAHYYYVKSTLETQHIESRLRQRLVQIPEETESIFINNYKGEDLESGLKRVYQRGFKADKIAFQDRSDNNLHEMRKRVKYLWYHIRLLKESWPGVMKSFGSEIHQLANLLGVDHDLSVFRKNIKKYVSNGNEKELIEKLVEIILLKRSRIQDDAFVLSAKIYAEKPGQFTQRIFSYFGITVNKLQPA